MRQFLSGTDTAFADLERRARSACVVFERQELPAGAPRREARVGFEVQETDGSAVLLVDPVAGYAGGDPMIRRWLSEGELRFPSFRSLQDWIRTDLARAYLLPSLTPVGPADALTDLGSVQDQLAAASRVSLVDPEDLFQQMALRVRGQDAALRTLATHTFRHLARRTPRRPLSLYAVGPTGVGKTKTAETLAEVLRTLDPGNQPYGFLRLDMAEYQERHRVSQLLGAPQGYVGYGDGAQLVETLARQPRTVVLFDEIEKAHPDVLRTLMNALDAGRLSSAAALGGSRQIDCREAIFYFTSNLDAQSILAELDQDAGRELQPERVQAVCRRHLRHAGVAPELIGRITSFLVFRPLSSATRAEIVTLAIARVAEEYGLRIARVEPSVVVAVLTSAQDADFGARPDEYLVDELLGATFADAGTKLAGMPLVLRSGPPFRCDPFGEDDAGPALDTVSPAEQPAG